MAAPQPSARLVRAVDAERAELERQRVRLTSEAAELRAALARIEHGLAEIDERCGLLDRLAAPAEVPRGLRRPRDAPSSAASLRGPAIREHARARAHRRRPRVAALPRVVRAARRRGLRDRGQGPARRLPHPDHPLAGGPQGRPRRGLRARPPGARPPAHDARRPPARAARADLDARPPPRTRSAPAATQLTAEIGRTERGWRRSRACSTRRGRSSPRAPERSCACTIAGPSRRAARRGRRRRDLQPRHRGAPGDVRDAAAAAERDHAAGSRRAARSSSPPTTSETILGFARVSAYSTRRAYAHVGEHAVYVAPHARGRRRRRPTARRAGATPRRRRATTS